MDNYYIIYDIITVILIASGVFLGMKRGFLRTVLSAAVWLAAFIGAAVISEAFSEPVYLKYAQPRIVAALENEMENARDSLKDRLSQEFDVDFSSEIADIYRSEYEEYLTDPEISGKIKSITDSVFSDFLFGLNTDMPVSVTGGITFDHFGDALGRLINGESVSEAAEYIEENAVRRIAVRIVSCALWSVSYAVIGFIGRMILSAVLLVKKLDTVRFADRALGGALGLAAAFLILIPAAAVTRLIVGLSDGGGFFSEAVINNTLLFKYLYYIIKNLWS